MLEVKEKCFVIMPFSRTKGKRTKEYWDKHFEQFLKPTISETGYYEVHRSKPLTGDILKQIINDLIVSPLVVADLTDANANVYWELGVRQSFKNGTITIAEEGTRLPFDLQRKATHFYYPKGDPKNERFKAELQETIKKVAFNQCGIDSEVLEAVSGRGTLFDLMNREEMIRRVEGLIEEVNENSNFIDTMIEALRKQIKAPIGYSALQYCALELLLTQRYLQDDKGLYGDARHLYLTILAANSAFQQYKDDWEKLSQFFPIDTGIKSLKERIASFCARLEFTLVTLKQIK